MMSVQLFWTLYDLVLQAGHYEDLCWAESVEPCADSLSFTWHHLFVVANSGLNAKVGERIAGRCWEDLRKSGRVSPSTFGHVKKVEAINLVYAGRDRYFSEYREAGDRMAYLRGLPHIGPVTCFHLAKNLGYDCAKPDRHLVRIAEFYGTDTHALCAHLAGRVGLRANTVDYTLWRASHLRIIRTEELSASGVMSIHSEGEACTEAEVAARRVYWEGAGSLPAAA